MRLKRYWYLLGRSGVPLERRVIGTACALLGGAFLAFQSWRLGHYLMASSGVADTLPVRMASWVPGLALVAIGMLAGVTIAAVWRIRRSPHSRQNTEKPPSKGITIEGEVLDKDN